MDSDSSGDAPLNPHVLHFLEFVLGIDGNQNSGWYMFWSGLAPSLAAWMCFLFAWFTLRIELQALRLETQLLAHELKRVSE